MVAPARPLYTLMFTHGSVLVAEPDALSTVEVWKAGGKIAVVDAYMLGSDEAQRVTLDLGHYRAIVKHEILAELSLDPRDRRIEGAAGASQLSRRHRPALLSAPDEPRPSLRIVDRPFEVDGPSLSL